MTLLNLVYDCAANLKLHATSALHIYLARAAARSIQMYAAIVCMQNNREASERGCRRSFSIIHLELWSSKLMQRTQFNLWDTSTAENELCSQQHTDGDFCMGMQRAVHRWPAGCLHSMKIHFLIRQHYNCGYSFHPLL